MDADVHHGGAGIFDCRGSVFLHQRKHPEDAADTDLSLLLIDQLAELADGDSGMFGATQLTRPAGELGICGKRPTKSGVTSLAGFAGSGVTSLAGFAGVRLPQARGIRMAIPAALR